MVAAAIFLGIAVFLIVILWAISRRK